jgi:hypothetical protein
MIMFGRKKEYEYIVYYKFQLDNGDSGNGSVPITTVGKIAQKDIKLVEKTVIERKKSERGGGKAMVTDWKEIR